MLKVTNLSVSYGGLRALTDVSLSVKEGQFVTVVGPNGAGKSTLFKTISGIVPAAGGQITFMGHNLFALPAAKRAHLGIAHVPEGRQVFKTLTVLENLEMGAYLRSDKKEIALDMENVYTRFPRLKERRKQMAGTLSGGEQQMLAIGRALMARPELLLMDEPSMGLAPLLVKEIFSIIKDINSRGTTILLIEQNANMALSIANKAYVIETGEIVLQGPAEQLMKSEEVKKAYLGG